MILEIKDRFRETHPRIPVFLFSSILQEGKGEGSEEIRERERGTEVYLTEERETTCPYLAAPACSLHSTFFFIAFSRSPAPVLHRRFMYIVNHADNVTSLFFKNAA